MIVENALPAQFDENTANIFLSQLLTHGYILSSVIKLPTLKCTRCGYEWHPRAERLPKVCANRECKSPYWNRKRTLKRRAA